jgi:NDP-sugar pyrophosphorylase family protein
MFEVPMDALILAGGTPAEDDPLYAYTQGIPKALLDIAGKPMAQWVVDAISEAASIDRIFMVGLGEDLGISSSKEIFFIPDKGGLLANVKAGFRFAQQISPDNEHLLVASSDVPAIRSHMIDWRVEAAMKDGVDLDYSVVERSLMESRFPGSNRSYLKLKDREVCGGDVNVARIAAIENEALWEKLISARKNVLRQASMIGFDTLFLLLTRRLALEDAVRIASSRLGLQGRVQISPFAEMAMDIDKPHQLEIIHEEFRNKAGTYS